MAAATTLSAGSLTATSDPTYTCGELKDIDEGTQGPNQECRDFTVGNCPGPDALVTLRVTLNDGDDGTIIFFSPAEGRGFWAADGVGEPDFPLPSHLLHRDLTTGSNDYKIVEVKWADSWHHGLDGNQNGPAKIACRVATVVEKLLDNSVYNPAETVVCATGQSGGANQLAYTLTHYGMEDEYDGVIFTSGPPYADLELACSDECDDNGIPDTSEGCFSSKSRWGVDTSYGTPVSPTWLGKCNPLGTYTDNEDCGDGEFPTSLCVNHQHLGTPPGNQDFADNLEDDSIAVNTNKWDYEYPNLEVFFVFGVNDTGAAKPQGNIYHDLLDSNTNNDVSIDNLAGVGHKVHNSEDGIAKIFTALASACSAVVP